jgi:hypothetical protein
MGCLCSSAFDRTAWVDGNNLVFDTYYNEHMSVNLCNTSALVFVAKHDDDVWVMAHTVVHQGLQPPTRAIVKIPLSTDPMYANKIFARVSQLVLKWMLKNPGCYVQLCNGGEPLGETSTKDTHAV